MGNGALERCVVRHTTDAVTDCLKLLRYIIALLVFIIALMIVSRAWGESSESVLAESTVGQGGLLCDTTEEVVAVITSLESGMSIDATLQSVAGCGILIVPMRMRVVALGTYETEKFKYLLVRYDFLDTPIPPQFGIEGRKSNGTGI